MHTEKSLGTILAETKDEIKQFVTTRVNILKAEIDEKVSRLKAVIPLVLVAAMFLLSGWMVFTFALIALLHTLFMPSAYAWLWASLIVTAVYLVVGGVTGWLAYAEIKATSLTPSRTLKVLQQDQVWIQNEARTA
ncbi:MAG TPA: phage holin family protein [Candidatus Dormibacteraeota bacterium]|nr:phage holin family protein [Candidatus Dormibacteraeota bacterium]